MSATEVYKNLEPAEIWRHFAALNGIPRGSGNETAARAYVQQVATENGAAFRQDGYGNTVAYVPAREGVGAEAPAVAIQAHLDMVCQKRPDVEHDFVADPIVPRIVGDRVYASGTTLGADNGIGAAMGLALLTSSGLRHGPLELLFTVEEETGLYGAANLDGSLLNARYLINLDSEDPRELTVGCAGGAGTSLFVEDEWLPVPQGWRGLRVAVGGLKGGHSGVQIHERLANAIKLLTRALLQLRENGVEFGLAFIDGGSAHNAIPRDAVAMLTLPGAEKQTALTILEETRRQITTQWHDAEPGFTLEAKEADAPELALSDTARDALLQLLNALPHGVLAMSHDFAGKVETSCNLAEIHTDANRIEIATSSRSFVAAELAKTQQWIAKLGEATGAEVVVRDGYPGWEPAANSELLSTTIGTYQRLFKTRPEVQVVHAGLECGIILDHVPGMQAISFGPRIEGAHTPEEHVYPETVATTWRLLTALLEALI